MIDKTDWLHYQAEGKTLFAAIQRHAGRLESAIKLVKQLETQPLELKQYLGKILLLIEAARPFPELHRGILCLLGLLETWTMYMDDWERWEAVLRFGVEIVEQFELPEQHVRLLNGLSTIFMNTGRPKEACVLIETGLELALQAGAAIPLATMIGNAVEILLYNQTVKEVIARLDGIDIEPCIRSASGIVAAQVNAYLYFAHARLSRQVGNLLEAFTYADRAIQCLESCPDVNLYIKPEAYRLRGIYGWAVGKPEAVHDLKRAVRLASEVGNEFTRANSLANLGLHYRNMGQLDVAEHLTKQAIGTARRLNAVWLVTREIGNLALVSLFQGRLREAEQLVKRHLNLSSQLGIESEINRAKANLGVIKLHQEEFHVAYQELEYSRKAFEKLGKLEGLAVIYANLCRCYVGTGAIKDARRLGKSAFRISRQLQSVPLEIMALRALAEAVPPGQAERVLHRAYSLSKGRKYDRVACLVSLASLELDNERRLHLWQHASRYLIKLGAGAWVQDNSSKHLPRLPALV